MNKHRRASLLLLAAALGGLVLLAGCGGEASEPSGSPTAQVLAIVSGETRADGEKGGYALEGEEISSNPGPTIRVKAGRPVEVSFDNVHGAFHGESIPHDFVVVADKDIEAAAPLSPGDALWGAQTKVLFPHDPAEVITFTPDKPGAYNYICSLYGHVDRGMWGRFIVEG